MAYTYDSNIVSDLHKDARGCRPTVHWMVEWDKKSPAQKQATWDSLCCELEVTMAEERAREAAGLRQFERYVERCRIMGAADTETAVRWILEGEGFDDMDYCYGADYCAFHFSLAYDNPFKETFARVCAAKAQWLHQEEAA